METNRCSTNLGFDDQVALEDETGNRTGYFTSSTLEPQYGFPQSYAAPYTTDHQHHFNSHDALDAVPEAMPTSDLLGMGPAMLEPAIHTAPTPHELLHVQNIYDAYVASYNDDSTSQSVRMDTAETFALALLKHYYPESEGYVVQRSSLGIMAQHGLNFMLKDPGGTDPVYIPRPPPSPVLPPKDPKKGRKHKKKTMSKAALAQKNKEKAEMETYMIGIHEYNYTMSVKWHQIEPEDILGMEVQKKHTTTRDGVEQVELRLHTVLAIVLAPPDILPQMAETNDVHRGDILTDMLCRSRQVRRGHGMLLFGTWLELYDFDNGAETRVVGDVEEEYQDGMVSYEEPYVTLCRSPDEQRLALDLRTVGLAVVDEVCQMVVRTEVVRLEEYDKESLETAAVEASVPS